MHADKATPLQIPVSRFHGKREGNDV
jgi:hypothetical protein